MSAPLIHPTAVIDPNATIGKDVSIGPLAVIGPDVTLADGVVIGAGAKIGAFHMPDEVVKINIGANTVVYPDVHIMGITSIGEACKILAGAKIGGPAQDKTYKNDPTEVIIGNRNTIGEMVTIHRGTLKDKGKTIIGNDNFLMAGSHVAHDCTLGNNVTMANNVLLAGHVKIDDYVTLGGAAALHQHVHIGQHAMVGGLSAVSNDILPYCMAFGSNGSDQRGAEHQGINLVGLKRRGFSHTDINQLREAFDMLFKKGNGITFNEQRDNVAAKYENSPQVQEMIQFSDASERGVAGGVSKAGKFASRVK